MRFIHRAGALSKTVGAAVLAARRTAHVQPLPPMRSVPQPMVSASVKPSSGASCGSRLVAPLISFQLDQLPPQLQREFDVAANQRALRHLVRNSPSPHTKQTRGSNAVNGSSVEGDGIAADSFSPFSSEIRIAPTSVHKAVWRCSECHTQWSARPSDRTNPQTADAYRCPACYGDATLHQDHLRATAPSSNPSEALSTEKKAPAYASSRLCEVYPALAAQWDTARNELLQNSVLHDVTEVRTSSSAKVWWQCPLCRTPWLESVSSRVARYVLATQSLPPSTKTDAAALVCSACERRGASGGTSLSSSSSSTASSGPRRWLSDDRLLLSEALLRPAQNPREISLTSETMLQWRCRSCQFEYVATVANRFLRHERCPQCTGKEKSMMNLLVIQRPDVVAEVSKYISRTKLRYITVRDDVELPFVCRTCFAHYRMTARARCAVPRGVPACPKCFLTNSQVLATAQRQAQQRGVAQLSARVRRRVREKALQLSRSNRSADRLTATANELQHRDGAMKD